MSKIEINRDIANHKKMIFAGDYEVVGPDPRLGQQEVADLGTSMIFIHYHHRHEFEQGGNKGLWGTICQSADSPLLWDEVEKTVEMAKQLFPLVALYPIGWAHMVPSHLGETVLDIDVETLSDWVCTVVGRFRDKVNLFPVFYELNVFDLFYRTTHGIEYSFKLKTHIVKTLVRSYDKVFAKYGEAVASKLTAGTFVELTESSFYWMSEGSLLELPRGSALLEAPLSPPDLIEVAYKLDEPSKSKHYESVVRQLLHQLVFWNADDSGAKNTVADDIRRISDAGWFHHKQDNPDGFIQLLIGGWDAQPQNTYVYLMNKMMSEHAVPSCARCLRDNYSAFEKLFEDDAVPVYVKDSIVGFVLDDVFKCTKQTGITSGIYPSEETITKGRRLAKEPLYVSDIGYEFKKIINTRKPPKYIENYG